MMSEGRPEFILDLTGTVHLHVYLVFLFSPLEQTGAPQN